MNQYNSCPFYQRGKYNRVLAWRITKDLSRREMQMILRFNLIEKFLNLNLKQIKELEKKWRKKLI